MENTQEIKDILEKKFKKMLGCILNELEISYDQAIRNNPEVWNNTRRKVIILTYKIISNMKKDIDRLYGHKYHIRLIPDQDNYENTL